MISIDVPGWKALRLEHVVLDLNGTLAVDGRLISGVAERLRALGRDLTLHLVSSDTQGTLLDIGEQLGVEAVRLPSAEPAAPLKKAFVERLGADSVAAIGNGANDVAMLSVAALGIVVLGREGTAAAALTAADVVASSIEDALDLLLLPDRLRGTLRA